MSVTSLKRKEEIRASIADIGIDATAEKYGLKRETVRRYQRKRAGVDESATNETVVTDSPIMAKIQARYSDKELLLIANGGIPEEHKHSPVHSFGGRAVKIGWMGDTHIGSVYTDYSYIEDAREQFAKADVDMVVVTGDVTEGMSNRPDHMFQCSELGYDAQKEKSIEIFSDFNFCPLYMIDGNHDRWYIKNSGAKIVQDICKEVRHAEFLGHDEGDIMIDGAVVKLWHGEDASSYAISYRLQKLIESLQGGEKPNLLFCGHVHKFGNFFIRNIHCRSTGSIQKQSKWMRGKRIEAHTCFGITTIHVNETGIGRISDEFFPFYA